MSNSGGDLDNSVNIQGSDGTLIANTGTALNVALPGTSTTTEAVFATFTLLSTATALANNKSMLSILNAGGSTVKIKLRSLAIINVQNAAVTGVTVDFNLFRITGHSAGTSLTPAPHDTTDALNVSVTARTGSTVAGEAATPLRHYEWSSDEFGPGTLESDVYEHALQTLLPAYFVEAKTKPITINAGEGLSVKCSTNTTAGSFDVLMVFTQETT